MELKLKLIGLAKQAVGSGYVNMEMSERATVNNLLENVCATYGEIKELQERYSQFDFVVFQNGKSLHEEDKIAPDLPVTILFPRVGG